MADTVKQGAGLRNVVAGESSISSIDGERGILAYRGIDIHALAEQSSFEEVSFLLHRGKLPTRAELAAFTQELARERPVPAPTVSVLRLFPASTHPTWRRTKPASAGPIRITPSQSLPASVHMRRCEVARWSGTGASIRMPRGRPSPAQRSGSGP